MRISTILFLSLVTAITAGNAQLEYYATREYKGMCDASGAVTIGSEYFAIANDEDNEIRIYKTDSNGIPVGTLDLSKFFQLDKGGSRKTELDIEGAARIGSDVYWITSHGRSNSGKIRANRHSFFITPVRDGESGLLNPTNPKPYRFLMERLLASKLVGSPQRDPFGLHHATQFQNDAYPRLAPKKEGANIEGLTSLPDGSLLLGFRNPIPGKKAILAVLANPKSVAEKHAAADFRDMRTVDLGGRGIRAMETWKGGAGFPEGVFVVAGPAGGKTDFALYFMAVDKTGHLSDPELVGQFPAGGMNPEAMIIDPQLGLKRVVIMNDDGTHKIKGQQCKDWSGMGQMQNAAFRAYWFDLTNKKIQIEVK